MDCPVKPGNDKETQAGAWQTQAGAWQTQAGA